MMKMPATVRVLSDRGSPSPSWDLLDDSDSDTRLSLSIPRSDFGDIAPPTGPEVPPKETFGFAIRPTAGSLQREREPLYEPSMGNMQRVGVCEILGRVPEIPVW
eukprot:628150_1